MCQQIAGEFFIFLVAPLLVFRIIILPSLFRLLNNNKHELTVALLGSTS